METEEIKSQAVDDAGQTNDPTQQPIPNFNQLELLRGELQKSFAAQALQQAHDEEFPADLDEDDEFENVDASDSADAVGTDESQPSNESDNPEVDLESDQIFSDDEFVDVSELDNQGRIPDPNTGEISTEDFIAGGYSLTALARQREEDAAAARAAASQNAGPQVEAPFRFSSQGRISGAIGAVLANTILRIGEVAGAGHGAITTTVAKSALDRSNLMIDQSLAEARVHLEALRPSVEQQSALRGEGESGPIELESPSDQAELSALVACFGKAQAGAVGVAKNSVHLGLDGDEAATTAMEKLSRFREEHADLLEKMRWQGESVYNRFGETLTNCFNAISGLFASLANKLGLGARAQEADASAAPRMV